MNEHAGSASALSVLIVAAFAILLHERPLSPKPTSLAARTDAVPKPVVKQPPPAPSRPPATANAKPPEPAREIPRPSAPAVPESATPRISPRSEPTPAQDRTEAPPKPESKTVIPEPPPTRPVLPVVPKSAFTIVQPGESLADVAARVYGTSDAAEALWRANRDQVASIDSRLTRGALLRTP